MKYLIITLLLFGSVPVQAEEASTYADINPSENTFIYSDKCIHERLSELEKRVEELEKYHKPMIIGDTFFINPSSRTLEWPPTGGGVNASVYKCSVCHKRFKSPSGGRIICGVMHPIGTCCHYGDEEIKE